MYSWLTQWFQMSHRIYEYMILNGHNHMAELQTPGD